MSDDAELERLRRQPPTDGLFAPPESTRHEAAIANVEAGQTGAEADLVRRIQSTLGDRHRWSADDVRDLLDAAGIPDVLAIRRRLSSQIVNGIHGKHKVGEVMTRHSGRSGRKVALWENWTP